MAILKIARMGHPVLSSPAAPVPDPLALDIRSLVASMAETMLDAGGAGLAAPQVHVPLRLFLFRVPSGRDPAAPEAVPLTVLINPVIEVLGDDWIAGWEGCLSIPGLRALVPRANRIRYTGIGINGATISREAEGFHARVVQHENDHLDGVLYPSRVQDFASFGFDEELARAQALQAEAEQDAQAAQAGTERESAS